MDRADDAALVRDCVRGNTASFEPLVKRYERLLFNVALRMVNDYEDARDITQSAFVKAYRKLGTYDPKFKFFSWIYRIMMNEALNHLGRRKQHYPLDPDLVSPRKSPEQEAQTSELRDRVQQALMTLSPDYRQVLILRHFVGLSYKEMGATLSIPDKTVKSRLFTARRLLSEALPNGDGP